MTEFKEDDILPPAPDTLPLGDIGEKNMSKESEAEEADTTKDEHITDLDHTQAAAPKRYGRMLAEYVSPFPPPGYYLRPLPNLEEESKYHFASKDISAWHSSTNLQYPPPHFGNPYPSMPPSPYHAHPNASRSSCGVTPSPVGWPPFFYEEDPPFSRYEVHNSPPPYYNVVKKTKVRYRKQPVQDDFNEEKKAEDVARTCPPQEDVCAFDEETMTEEAKTAEKEETKAKATRTKEKTTGATKTKEKATGATKTKEKTTEATKTKERRTKATKVEETKTKEVTEEAAKVKESKDATESNKPKEEIAASGRMSQLIVKVEPIRIETPEERRERKNAVARARASRNRERFAEIELKPEGERTQEEKDFYAHILKQKSKKNNRSRSRAAENNSEVDRIRAKPEKERTKEENDFLDYMWRRKIRKNQGDVERRKRIKREQKGK